MGSDPRAVARWRTEVFRSTAVTDSTKVLLLRLADVMDAKGYFTVPRLEMAEWINRSERRVQERLENAVQGRLIDRVETGHRGRTATYRALWPNRDSGTVHSPLSAPDSGTVSVDSETVQSPLKGAESRPLSQSPSRSDRADSGTHVGPASIGETPKALATRRRRAAEPAGFAEWYLAYPRHDSRPAAATAYGRALERATADVLLAAALRHRHDPNRQDTYTKHPATWLNNDGWLNGPLPARANGLTKAEERDRRNLALVQSFGPTYEQGVIGA